MSDKTRLLSRSRFLLCAFMVASFPLMATLQGCTSTEPIDNIFRPDLIKVNQQAADALVSKVVNLDPRRAILVTNLVRLENPGESARFGRLCAQQIGNRFTTTGLAVVTPDGLKLDDQIMMQSPSGLQTFTPDVQKLIDLKQIQAMTTGTFTISGTKIYVSLKMVSTQTMNQISAYDYTIPLDGNTAALMY